MQGIVEAAEGAWPREEKMRGGPEHCAFWHRERFLSISWCASTAVLVILSCGLRRDPAPYGRYSDRPYFTASKTEAQRESRTCP